MSHTIQCLLNGFRPTADLHLGNYIGGIKPMVDFQEDYSVFISIVDLHAIVTPYDPKQLPRTITTNAIDFLSSGLDPKKSTLFIQSHVPQHCELMWLLNTVTPVGELQRMVQYKEFKERYGDPLAGILNYPILMAADVLLYTPDAVPVGEDQNQHMELTRDIAKKFNHTFGDVFPLPKTITPNIGGRVMSLNDPAQKMSKSLGPKSYIALSDDPDTIRKKIMSAVTDSGEKKKKSKKKDDAGMSPGVKNLFDILHLTSPAEVYDHMYESYSTGDLQYAELKSVLADHIIEYLNPIQKKRKEFEANLDYVAHVLAEGSEKARSVASETLTQVKEKMGLL